MPVRGDNPRALAIISRIGGHVQVDKHGITS